VSALVDLEGDLVVLKNKYARMNVRLLEKTVRLIDKLDVKSVELLKCVLVVVHLLGKERKERILLVD
jgi:hypothetical protein